jgi:hypothetical protein
MVARRLVALLGAGFPAPDQVIGLDGKKQKATKSKQTPQLKLVEKKDGVYGAATAMGRWPRVGRQGWRELQHITQYGSVARAYGARDG